jgi:hypothetical protein
VRFPSFIAEIVSHLRKVCSTINIKGPAVGCPFPAPELGERPLLVTMYNEQCIVIFRKKMERNGGYREKKESINRFVSFYLKIKINMRCNHNQLIYLTYSCISLFFFFFFFFDKFIHVVLL